MTTKIWVKFKTRQEFQLGVDVLFSIPGTVMKTIGKMTTSHGNTKYRIYLEHKGVGCDFTLDADSVEELSPAESHLCELLAA